ncbi:hypothetical protein RF11_13054 [Thelohanellus kitauei]|uniref:BPTI/Kunitz inhibitor domain-containing protein n=1 Tax=Thelohanellus kitauei TaxID=669202 RepID=A0A0C2JKA6_THEKT|nr:hypothetical protein RF11_13054 [Thelohanellus kitauei]
MNVIFVPSKCHKPWHEGNCESNPKSTFYFFDSTRRFCGEYQACGPVKDDVNMFTSMPDCKAECASPFRVKRRECLIDWGLRLRTPTTDGKKIKRAYNKYTGMCEVFIKQKGYPTPPLFDTWDECDRYCLIDILA